MAPVEQSTIKAVSIKILKLVIITIIVVTLAITLENGVEGSFGGVILGTVYAIAASVGDKFWEKVYAILKGMLLGGSGGIIAAAIATILGADMFQTFIGVLSGAFIMTISSILIGSVLSILFRWIGEGFSETPFAIVVAGIGGGFLAVGAVRLAVPLLYQKC